MTKTITFTGWGQKHDALESIAPDANHIDYLQYNNIRKLFKDIKGIEADTAIGWSLGGQVLLRAIDDGIITANKMILIATPFQFVIGRGLKCGIDADTFNGFESDFAKNPEKTLKQFAVLISKNDELEKDIAKQLQDDIYPDHKNLGYWLEQLRTFSCQKLNFFNMPETISIHGRNDKIVDFTQTSLFRPFIKKYKIETFEQCGHAPHLHDEERVREIVEKG